MLGQFPCDITNLSPNDSGVRRMPPELQVIHTNEPGPYRPGGNPGSLDGLLSFLANPNTQASYTTVVDAAGRTGRSNDDEFAPWAAGTTANSRGLHLCVMGWAKQPRSEWLSRTGQMHSTARILAWNNALYGIPLQFIGPKQLRNRERGVCGHVHVAQAWGETDHTDPGPEYPFDVVISMAKDINNGSPEEWIETMANVRSHIDGKEHTPEAMLGFIDMHTYKSYNEHGALLKEIRDSLVKIVAAMEKKG